MGSDKVDLCPLCSGPYAAMSSHLKQTHSIENQQEWRLLLNLASGRVNIRSSLCPIDRCNYNRGRLDKHLIQGHKDLSETESSSELQRVRKRVTIKMISALRPAEVSTPPDGGSRGRRRDPADSEDRAEAETVQASRGEPTEALPGC